MRCTVCAFSLPFAPGATAGMKRRSIFVRVAVRSLEMTTRHPPRLSPRERGGWRMVRRSGGRPINRRTGVLKNRFGISRNVKPRRRSQLAEDRMAGLCWWLCSRGPRRARHDSSCRHSCSRRSFPTLRRPDPGRATLPSGPPEPTRRCRALGGARTRLPGPRPARRGRDELASRHGAAPHGRRSRQRSRSRVDRPGPAR